jgi:thiamine pyrophosphokinase
MNPRLYILARGLGITQTNVSPMLSLDYGELITRKDYQPFVLLILNMPIECTTHFGYLIVRASSVVCADGGYGRLLDYYQAMGCSRRTPDMIIGDMDSTGSDALCTAKLAGIPIIKNLDESRNDFQKALDGIKKEPFQMAIVAVGALDGRFDQTCASVSVLFEFPNDRIWLVSSSSIVTRLDPV